MYNFEKKCKLNGIELETTGFNVICQTIRKVVVKVDGISTTSNKKVLFVNYQFLFV